MYKTQEEYRKGYIRMMNSLRAGSDHIGEPNCEDVECENCPIDKYCSTVCGTAPNSFDVMQMVWDWNQAHPVVTNEMKAIEVFGQKFRINCYRDPESNCICIGNGKECKDRNCKFYKDSEYHAPESVRHE